MLPLKQIKDDTIKGINNNQTPQEVLCKLILWRFSDIERSLKLDFNKKCSIENFLSIYLKIEINELKELLEKLKYYKDVIDKDVICTCTQHR